MRNKFMHPADTDVVRLTIFGSVSFGNATIKDNLYKIKPMTSAKTKNIINKIMDTDKMYL